jgi:hypothetical protein
MAENLISRQAGAAGSWRSSEHELSKPVLTILYSASNARQKQT